MKEGSGEGEDVEGKARVGGREVSQQVGSSRDGQRTPTLMRPSSRAGELI